MLGLWQTFSVHNDVLIIRYPIMSILFLTNLKIRMSIKRKGQQTNLVTFKCNI